MKKILLVLILLFTSLVNFAQNKNRSTLHIRLSDGSPLIITINDREFKKVNTKITLFDLPGKRHYLKVYKFRPYSDGNGGKAELVYSGRFKITPGSVYDCIVDLNQHKLLVKNISETNNNSGTYMPPAPPPNAKNDVILDPQNNMSGPLIDLQYKMDNNKEDSKKLELAKNYIQSKAISTKDLKTITNWLMFDDTKMDLLKYAYSNLKDKNNFGTLIEVFTLPEAKETFKKYALSLE